MSAARHNPETRAARHIGDDPELSSAAELLRDFSGHEATELVRVPKKSFTKGLVLGTLDGVLYTTVRDDKREAYIHEFRKQSRPLLAVSSDGTQIGIVGGRYQVTEAGIEDR